MKTTGEGARMKLESVEINDFRGIRHLQLDFQDELGLIRDRTVLVGPNASGKTSILDAITLGLLPVTELGFPRPGLILSPASIVRRGAVQTQVRCTVRFDDNELEAIHEVYEKVGWPHGRTVPQARTVKVEWRYPDLKGQYRSGWSHFEPARAYTLFKARVTAARSLHVPGVTPRSFERLGGLFFFDQQRTGLGKRLRPSDLALIRPGYEAGLAPSAPGEGNGRDVAGEPAPDYTRDPRTILISLAARAQAPQDPETTDRQDYERLCELYARMCQPHRIVGLYNTEHGLDLEFAGDQGVYRYDGLSSGQEMILMMLLQFATRHIHRSIVLIDELELHQHPLWQDRLYNALDELGNDNQFILTTHSTHLRDGMQNALVHHTGRLGERLPVSGKD